MSLKQRKIKIKPRIKLNHNIYIGSKCVTALIIQFSFCHFFFFYYFFFCPLSLSHQPLSPGFNCSVIFGG